MLLDHFNEHITLISEGKCDTKTGVRVVSNSALHQLFYIVHFKILLASFDFAQIYNFIHSNL